MATVVEDPMGLPLARLLFANALNEWGGECLTEMKRRVHKISRGLERSLVMEPAEIQTDEVFVVFSDGPGRQGRIYGVYEEVVRGGQHAFMRPTIDAKLRELPPKIHEKFR